MPFYPIYNLGAGGGATYQRVVYVVGTGGQSNKQYWGTAASSTDAARLYYSDPRISVWGGASGDGYVGAKALLTLPRQTVDRTGNVAGRTGYGTGYGIARAILKHTANPLAEVLIVDCAIGDTSITETGAPTWRVASSSLTANMISRVNAALASDPDCVLHSLHWCQGERDANLGTSAGAYITALDSVFAALRAGITGAATVRLLIYEMVPYWQANPATSSYSPSTTVAAIQAIATGHTSAPWRTDGAYSAFVPGPTGIGACNATETVHYNAASCFSLGESAIATYLAVAEANTPGSISLPLAPTVSVTPTGSGTATVTITPAGGSHDGFYTVEVQANGAGSWTLIANTGARLTVNLTGQADGLRNCRVRAVNRIGQAVSYGTASWTQAPIPTAPVLSTGTISTSIGLSWTASTGGTGITYRVQYKATASPTWLDFATGVSGTTSTVSGLTNGISFDCRVIPSNVEYGEALQSVSNTVTATTGSVPTISNQRWGMPVWGGSASLHFLATFTGGTSGAVTFGVRAAGTSDPFTPVTPTSTTTGGAVLPVDPAAASVEIQAVGSNTVTLTWLVIPQPFFLPDIANMTYNGSNQITSIPNLGTNNNPATQVAGSSCFTRDTTTVSGKVVLAHTAQQYMIFDALPAGKYMCLALTRDTASGSNYGNDRSSQTAGGAARWFSRLTHTNSLNIYASHAAPTDAVGPSSAAITLNTWRGLGWRYAAAGGTLTLLVDGVASGSATVADRSVIGTSDLWNGYATFASSNAGRQGQTGNRADWSGNAVDSMTDAAALQMLNAMANELGVTIGA